MSRKLRLAFFAEILIEDFDGASRTITHILQRIPKDQYEVLLICGIPPKKETHWEVFKVSVVQIPFNRDYSMAVPQFKSTRLRQKLSDFNPDVIHISTPSMLGQFALSYGRKYHIPVISIYHTHFISYIDYYLKGIKSIVPYVKSKIIDSQKRFYSQCNKVYIPTQAMKKELVNMGFSEHNFSIWPRGINTATFSPSHRDLDFMASLVGNQNKNILFASRLVWEKNLETLVKIYHVCKLKKLPYNFVIAGDGVAKESLQNLMPDAIFVGHQNHDQLAVLYASCDMFLFTSISETFGNVVVEAQASGIPVVIADGGGSAGLVAHGINGFLCAPQDAGRYVEYITEIFEQDTLKASLILHGLESVKQFQWNTLMDIYLHDLETLKYHRQQLREVSVPLPMELAM